MKAPQAFESLACPVQAAGSITNTLMGQTMLMRGQLVDAAEAPK